jgi:hypothetical protein
MVIMMERSRSTAPSTVASTMVLPRAELVDEIDHDHANLHGNTE